MTTSGTIFHVPENVAIVFLLVFIVVLFILLLAVNRKVNYISRKYHRLMTGKGGRDLEETVLTRFREMDHVKKTTRRIAREHDTFKDHLDSCYNKLGIVKFNSFDDMAGELSFSLCLLNQDNCGFVLTTMHTREGCYTYTKEIDHGNSYQVLTNEEIRAIKAAMTNRHNPDTDQEDNLLTENWKNKRRIKKLPGKPEIKRPTENPEIKRTPGNPENGVMKIKPEKRKVKFRRKNK